MRAKLVIPLIFPGLNDYINAERSHRQKAAKMKKEYQDAVMLCIRSQRLPTFDGPVYMYYTWVEKDRRRDKDNIAAFGRKVIQDALVKAGVLKNDGWANITGFSDAFSVDKGEPRVEVILVGVLSECKYARLDGMCSEHEGCGCIGPFLCRKRKPVENCVEGEEG